VGSVTTGGAPTKLLPVAWQVAQAMEVTAECTIAVPAKVVNVVVEWQLSQAMVPVGIWLLGKVFTGGAPVKDSPDPWHAMQLVLKLAWFIAVPANVVNAVAEWQLSQAIAPTGMCPAGSTLRVGGAILAKLEPAA